MLRNISIEQTIEGKKAFEKELAKHNMKVMEYRADNSYFAEKAFWDEINECN